MKIASLDVGVKEDYVVRMIRNVANMLCSLDAMQGSTVSQLHRSWKHLTRGASPSGLSFHDYLGSSDMLLLQKRALLRVFSMTSCT